ncbi:DUF448 domain-containing protein [Alphaproteobacteria bacterium]|nr:DUF448 domain-containing protein [Alphaproteobacteria bacterium]
MAERTCIATGQTLPPHKLIRFVAAPDGYAVADLAGRLPGRGAWVTAEESVIRKADQKSHLKRAIGVGLKSVDADITAIVLRLRERIIATASMARRAGMVIGGGGKLLSEGHFEGLLAAVDASPRELAKMKSKLGVDWVSQSFSATELGRICGRDSLAFVGLRAPTGNGSEKLVRTIHEDIMRLDGFYTAAGCNNLPDRCIT